ncbi:hypothetical protein EMPS_08188 [Entomortierella parvispora]|uniref:G-patch domain-containing protein n=1 Tax=Entomortierella parvispora TaxID=205924 RepID=A0A9P3HFX6_9FUNG|nr:hypothetical protein EMPS_08188 [Entomortierella parvispora]
MQQFPPQQQQQQVQRFYRQELEQLAQTRDAIRAKHRPTGSSESDSDLSYSDDDEHASRYQTEAASMETHIPESNIGYRLLLKMGWKAGTGLGQNASGRTAPIPIERKNDALGIGKQEVDRWYTENSTAQRKALEVERQAAETEHERIKREAQVEQQKAIQAELEAVKSAFYCALCDKQYERISDFEVHLSSYDHNHKKRFKDMKETSRAGAASANNKIKDKERKREERELARMQEAALKRAGVSSTPTTQAPPASSPAPPTVTPSGSAPSSGFQPIKLSGFQSVASPQIGVSDSSRNTTPASTGISTPTPTTQGTNGFQPVKLGGFQPVKLGGGGFKAVKLGGFQPVDDDEPEDASAFALAGSSTAPSSAQPSETGVPKMGFQPIKMKIGGFQLKRPGAK